MNWGFSNDEFETDDRVDNDDYLNSRAKIVNSDDSEEEEDDGLSVISEGGEEVPMLAGSRNMTPYTNKRIEDEKLGLREYREKFQTNEDKKKQAQFKSFFEGGTKEVKFNTDCVNWSNRVLKPQTVAFIPSHCHVVAETTIYHNETFDGNGDKRYMFNKQDFYSHDAYCQGINIPYENEPRGDTQNVYFASLTFQYIHNKLPVPVTIRLSHTSHEEEEILPNGKVRYKNESYHAVIPPGVHHNLNIYLSTKTVNDTFGADFPSYTYENVANDLKAIFDNIAIKKTSPLAWWYHKNRRRLRWPVAEYAQKEESFVINQSRADICVKGVRDIIKNKLQIIDVDKLYMDIKPISGVASTVGEVEFILHSRHIFRDNEDNKPEKMSQADKGLAKLVKTTVNQANAHMVANIDSHYVDGQTSW